MASVSPLPTLTIVMTTTSLGKFDYESGDFNVTSPSGNNTEYSSASSNHVQGRSFQWGMLGLTLIIICTAIGNLLVCLAVCWEKRLQNMTNYFLMSLAIADFLVSLLVMPLGMIVEIFGRFPMNPEICVLWVASDVLMCTASIWHMCTMSMDRYFTLNYPMRYGRNKTRRMVAGKILFVWVVSMAISSPVCIHGFIDTSIVYNDGMCVPVLENFLIYGSIFAFYIPLLIMIITYVLTIRILWKNQQRMKHIERSDMKPRLAQLTAQCTGFAIPKLLTNLRRPSKTPSTSQTSLGTLKGEKPMLSPSAAHRLSFGNVNATLSESDLRSFGGSVVNSRKSMTYLAPPTPQTCTRSPSPASTQIQMNSESEDSESEPNYFSLLQSSQSCRSLTTPISLTTSEKSLHRRLQKKKLFQHQQQELQQLRPEYHHQRLVHIGRDDTSASPSPTSPLSSPNRPDSLNYSTPPDSFRRSPSSQITPLFDEKPLPNSSFRRSPSSQTTPLFDEKPLPNSKPPLNIISPLQPPPLFESVNNITPSLVNKDRKDTSTNRLSKRKRYSKRSKKRRGSLPKNQDSPNNLLEVPSSVFNRRVRSNKHTSGHSVLSTAKSDTQVSQAGRGMASDDDRESGMSSFHLSCSNLCKDYKSVEWDRRFFQIQEEMDQCLMEDVGRQSKPEVNQDKTDTNKTASDRKLLIEPESSIPVFLKDPLDVQACCPALYSHSAPNSPLNRRPADSSLTGFTSGSESEEELANENSSDKNNADDDNDTSVSSNDDDVITIRLHPPSPKVKNLQESANKLDISCVNKNLNFHDSHLAIDKVPCCENAKHVTRSEHLNGIISHVDQTVLIPYGNTYVTTLKKGSSAQSLSPISSTLPELIISSEGEMTLEETDDTLDDSPKSNRIKLRRPIQPLQNNKQRFRKKHQSPNREMPVEKYSKVRKRSSFRNTFRIHRGKYPSKHILSKKTASNERKASKVLGIIFLVFVILWTPFFTVNILSATCASCINDVTQEMMSLFLWMGYIASLANPIIYTMFNTAFRRTFIRILTCKIQRTCGNKTSDNPYMSYTTMLASERRNTMTVVLRDESK